MTGGNTSASSGDVGSGNTGDMGSVLASRNLAIYPAPRTFGVAVGVRIRTQTAYVPRWHTGAEARFADHLSWIYKGMVFVDPGIQPKRRLH